MDVNDYAEDEPFAFPKAILFVVAFTAMFAMGFLFGCRNGRLEW